MESSTWQLSCSRLAGSLWGGIAPEHQPAQPHYTATDTEVTTKFRESFYKIWRRPRPSRHFQRAPISVFLGILEKLSFDFVDSSTYMAPPSPWQSHSMVVAPPPPLTIISDKLAMSETLFYSDTTRHCISAVKYHCTLYRSNHYQSRDIRTNTEPMSDTDPGSDCTDLLAR